METLDFRIRMCKQLTILETDLKQKKMDIIRQMLNCALALTNPTAKKKKIPKETGNG